MKQVPARSALADALSKALKRRGPRFVGTRICYAFMQAVGMLNDHPSSCFRYALPDRVAGNETAPPGSKTRKEADK